MYYHYINLSAGPIDFLTFQSDNYHIVRQSTVSGSCRATGSFANSTQLTRGSQRIQFHIQDCPGFGGFVYDAFTGFNSVSRIRIEETIPSKHPLYVTCMICLHSFTTNTLISFVGDNTFPIVRPIPPPGFVYTPHYCQFYYPHLGVNRERNLGTVAEVKFMKDHDHTVLRITWEGNFRFAFVCVTSCLFLCVTFTCEVCNMCRKKSCNNCCVRWWFSIDGSPCSNFENIETSISSSVAYDIFAPTTLTGMCNESQGLPLSMGLHNIQLLVGNCLGAAISNAASGFFSGSRMIVEEIPARESVGGC